MGLGARGEAAGEGHVRKGTRQRRRERERREWRKGGEREKP